MNLFSVADQVVRTIFEKSCLFYHQVLRLCFDLTLLYPLCYKRDSDEIIFRVQKRDKRFR